MLIGLVRRTLLLLTILSLDFNLLFCFCIRKNSTDYEKKFFFHRLDSDEL